MNCFNFNAVGIAATVALASWPIVGWPDIRGIDFRNMDYPTGQCHEDAGIGETVTVRNGEFSEETQGGKSTFKIIGDVLYRDLTGDGRDEAVVTARCTLEGAESETTQLYVFGLADAKPVLLGRIDPAGMLRDYQRYYPDGQVLWRIGEVDAKDGSLLLATSADGDPDKPQWQVSMAYRWDGKTFTVAAKPERQPAGASSHIALGTTQAQASQPGRITVTVGMCLCGEQSGGFDATYRDRTIDVGFTRGAAAPASAPGQPLNQPLKVLAGQRELKDEEWSGLVCKQGEEPQPCAITGKTVEIEGQWDGDEAFTAQVLYLSQEAQGNQKPIGETPAVPVLGAQATYIPTPSSPAVSPPAAEAPAPAASPATGEAAEAPVVTSSPSLPPEQLGPQLVKEMLAYARDNAGVGHEEEIQGTKKRLDWLPSPVAVNQAKARKANRRGQAELRAGRIKAAIKTLEEALGADPGDVEILNNLGYAYFRQGDLDQAEHYMISALTINPARAPIWANLGQIYAKKGDIPNAVASFVNSYRFSKNRLKTQQFFQQLSDKERDPKVTQALQESMALAREHLMSAGRDLP